VAQFGPDRQYGLGKTHGLRASSGPASKRAGKGFFNVVNQVTGVIAEACADRQGRIAVLISRPGCLIRNELSYAPVVRTDRWLLLYFIGEHCERTSMIVTTNLEHFPKSLTRVGFPLVAICDSYVDAPYGKGIVVGNDLIGNGKHKYESPINAFGIILANRRR
jgi:hypothetical protein